MMLNQLYSPRHLQETAVQSSHRWYWTNCTHQDICQRKQREVATNVGDFAEFGADEDENGEKAEKDADAT